MTPQLLLAIKEKHKAKRKAVGTGDPHDLAAYRWLKNRLKISVHEAKLSYLKSLATQSKRNPHLSSQLWRNVNNIIGRSKSYDSGLSTNFSPDSVNEFFCNVAVTDAHLPAEQFVASSSFSSSSFKFAVISADTVLCMLQCLDIQKSTGPDGLSAWFL